MGEYALEAKIVDAVLSNLRGRKGVGDELDMVDPDIYAEMYEELTELVGEILKEQDGKA